MRTIFVIIVGYYDGGIESAEIIAAFASKDAAERVLALINAGDPSKAIRLVEVPFEYGE